MRLRSSYLRFLVALLVACSKKTSPISHDPDTKSGNQPARTAGAVVDDFKITLLSDMVVSRHTNAEWGFSALVEVTRAGQTKRILFDTGGSRNLVLENAAKLVHDGVLQDGVLCSIDEVVLSHNHSDHTNGLLALRQACVATNPGAFSRAYVGGDAIFWPRPNKDGSDDNVMTTYKAQYEAAGGTFVMADKPIAWAPGVTLTGKIARAHDEKTYPSTPNFLAPDGTKGVDIIPEEQALVINTAQGVVVLTGCAHAGIINTIETARAVVGGDPPVLAAIGGMHTIARPIGNPQTEGSLKWFGKQFKALGVKNLFGAHCTGLERLPFLRAETGLDDKHALLTTVGFAYSLSAGVKRPTPSLDSPLDP